MAVLGLLCSCVAFSPMRHANNAPRLSLSADLESVVDASDRYEIVEALDS
jgi:hypothetical protein